MNKMSTIHPVGADWDWQHDGLCRTRSPELFFHPDGERGSVKRAREARAIALCQQCPVIDACRNHALSVPETYGVWGGLTEEEREELLLLETRRIS